MGKNRKDARAKQQASASPASKTTAIDIPEEEQWRIIKESGILKQAGASTAAAEASLEGEDEDYEISPLADEVFRALYLVIPMSFLLLLMDILVHYQYGRKPPFEDLRDRMLPGVPSAYERMPTVQRYAHTRTTVIYVFVFYSNRYKTDKRVQAALFWLSCIAGTRLIWLLNRGNWLTVMQQCPPIATAWVYAVVQLNLGPAVLSLVVAAAYTRYKGFTLSI
ncbi:hypothetical protein BC628DRAFT_1135412 [Trametes gibbosa]|nr:hypothetical protein BC628DRAFT_1135412 [Trametes gibbosa]